VVSHGLIGCNKKTIKNKLVATRSEEVTICGEISYKWTSGQKWVSPKKMEFG
jgi:hypothetical protein